MMDPLFRSTTPYLIYKRSGLVNRRSGDFFLGDTMKQSIKMLCEATAICVAIGACAIIIAMLWIRYPETTQSAGYVAEPKVKAAMEYHGDKFTTFSDENGVLWFRRNGQDCRLFTGAFREYWMKTEDLH